MGLGEATPKRALQFLISASVPLETVSIQGFSPLRPAQGQTLDLVLVRGNALVARRHPADL